MEFKVGDYVKLKDLTELETGELISDWAGKITELYPTVGSCLLELDAQTLGSLDDAYLLDSAQQEEDALYYGFPEEAFVKSERRDTDKELKLAQEKVKAQMDNLLVEDEDFVQIKIEQWSHEFQKSSFFGKLNPYQKEHADFVISTFMELMGNYEDARPDEWTPYKLEVTCLDTLPRKVSIELVFFENYGYILLHFLRFLEEKKYISNSPELQEAVIEIKDEIADAADNPDNWGIAKSFIMMATEQGYDVDNQEDLNAFVKNFNMNPMAHNEVRREEKERAIESSNPPLRLPDPLKNPYRHIGRNQKVTVKYPDGRIVEDVKFKKIQKDLLSGDCELLEV